MVKINLSPQRPMAAFWKTLEKGMWILWLSLPFAILLWAKLVMNSK